MLKRYYVFRDRDWKACGTVEIDPQSSDDQVVVHLKSMGYLDARLDAGDVRVLRPKVGDVLLLQHNGDSLVELCAA